METFTETTESRAGAFQLAPFRLRLSERADGRSNLPWEGDFSGGVGLPARAARCHEDKIIDCISKQESAEIWRPFRSI